MRHTERGWITDDDAMLFGPGCKLDLAHDRTVRPGDVVRVTLTSGESLMRKLQRDARGGWLLVAWNREYEDRHVKEHEIRSVHAIEGIWLVTEGGR